jgi:hypothetical protein
MPNLTNISLNSAEALFPTAYSVQQIIFRNHSGRELDLKALVTDFSITESIYRPSLMLSLNVRDPVNTMEELQISGQEKISVLLARTPYGSQDQELVSLDFIVTEYPLFGRMDNRLQVYSLRAVSPHAYVSELKKISRAFSGTIQDFIKEVLRTDLGVSENMMEISSGSTSYISFIVPNMAPLDAIYWALRRAYDQAGSPFYFYQRLDGVIVFESQAEIMSKEVYKEYKDAKFFQFNQTGDTSIRKDYEERALRILSMNSDVRMSKYGSIPSGAYSSRSEYLDLSTKTLSRSSFKYDAEFNSMIWSYKNPVVSTTFKPDNPNNTLSEFTDSLVNYIPTNKLAFSSPNYHSTTENGKLNKAQSYIENMDSISHDITVAGDFKLQCGKIISLKIPPAIDPGANIKNTDTDNDIQRDNYFSGKYMITSVLHSFSEEYKVNLQLKRDSLTFKLQ